VTRDVLGRRYERTMRRHLAAARRRLLGQGLLLALAGAALSTALLALMIGWPGVAPVWVKIPVCVLALGSLAWLVWETVLRPVAGLGRLTRFTARIDDRGGHRNILVAAEESLRRPERWRGPDVLTGCTDRLLAEADARAAGLDARGVLGLPRWRPVLVLSVLAAALVSAGAWLNDDEISRGAARLVRPLHVEGRLPTAGLRISAVPAAVVAGEDIVVGAVDLGTPREAVHCEVRSGSGAWQRRETALEPSWRPRPYRRYRTVLRDMEADFQVRFVRDGMVTAARGVEILHPPLLIASRVEIAPPAYTGLPVQRLSPAPAALEALVGSRLRWHGTVDHDVVAAAALTAGGDTLAWTASGDSIVGEFTARAPLDWRLEMTDARGLVGGQHVRYELAVRADEPPRVALTRERHDGLLPGDGLLDLVLQATDDFGVAGLELLARREAPDQAPADTAWTRVPLPLGATSATRRVDTALGELGYDLAVPTETTSRTRLTLALRLDAAALELLPGEALALAVEARDNRRPGPAGRGRSGVLRFFLPSAADLLASQAETDAERLSDLDDLRRRSDALADELARMERELKKNPAPDFARRQEIDDALSRQQAVQEALESLTDDLRRDLDEAASRNLASTDLIERMERVAELMDEIENEALDSLREQLREAMAELSEEDIGEAMSEVAKRQQEFLDKLDRAIALLEELKREQEMSGLAAVLEEMMRRQEELLEPGPAPDPEGADRQAELASELEELRERMEQALADLERSNETSPAPSDEAMREALEEALEELSDGDLQEAMERSEQGMRQPDQEGGSSDAGHQAMRKLASLYHVLLQGQQGMQMAMETFAKEIMLRLTHDLLKLSRRQEELVGRIPANLRDLRAPALPRDEQRLLRALVGMRDRLGTALGASGRLPFGLLDGLDDVADILQRTVASLEAGYGRQSMDASRSALGSLNRLVMQLLTSAQMTGGGGSCSMPMPMLGQQLEQMAREQAGLNGLTEEMRQQLAERQRQSQQSQARMQRLQADQRGLAKQMLEAAELERDQPQGARLLGDLEELARDMERVADELGAGRIDEEILRRQERILSRMLDAHNSVRRRDYARRRESRAETEIYARQSGESGDGRIEAEAAPWRLRQEQIERVPPEYRELVRRYFRALRELEAAPAGPAAGGRP